MTVGQPSDPNEPSPAGVPPTSSSRRPPERIFFYRLAIGSLVLLAATWSPDWDDRYLNEAAITAVINLTAAVAALYWARRRPSDSSNIGLLAASTLISLAAAAGFTALGIATESDDLGLWRLIGVFWVLSSLGLVVTPIARKANT